MLAVLIVSLCACEVEEERPSSYYSINGEIYEIPLGFIDDDGTNSEITYRYYDILLSDHLEIPQNYIAFTIHSLSTQRLAEGTYEFSSYGKGVFNYFELGQNIKYDSSGEAISGVRMSYYNISNVDGTIIVEQEDGDYRFIFEISFEYNSKNYEIKGEYWAPLTEYNYL